MADIQSLESDPLQTQRPSCPRCGARMSMTRIEPETPGIDRRTFECAQCQHIETILVAFQ
jgi:ribosomal protein S27AE